LLLFSPVQAVHRALPKFGAAGFSNQRELHRSLHRLCVPKRQRRETRGQHAVADCAKPPQSRVLCGLDAALGL